MRLLKSHSALYIVSALIFGIPCHPVLNFGKQWLRIGLISLSFPSEITKLVFPALQSCQTFSWFLCLLPVPVCLDVVCPELENILRENGYKIFAHFSSGLLRDLWSSRFCNLSLSPLPLNISLTLCLHSWWSICLSLAHPLQPWVDVLMHFPQ